MGSCKSKATFFVESAYQQLYSYTIHIYKHYLTQEEFIYNVLTTWHILVVSFILAQLHHFFSFKSPLANGVSRKSSHISRNIASLPTRLILWQPQVINNQLIEYCIAKNNIPIYLAMNVNQLQIHFKLVHFVEIVVVI